MKLRNYIINDSFQFDNELCYDLDKIKESVMKKVFIPILLSLSLFITSCNTIGGFARGVVDDVRTVIPGI
tara:strand:+ start:107 stop:316 length:210 start_codon:yes stop_codon:yes gene_type:complete